MKYFLYYYQVARSSGSNKAKRKQAGATTSSPKKKGKAASDPQDFNYYKKWLIRRATSSSVLFNVQYNNKIRSFSMVEIGGNICVDECEHSRWEMNLSEPPKIEPRSITVTRSEKVNTFCKLPNSEKRKICRRLPLVWKLFLDPVYVEAEVSTQQLGVKEEAACEVAVVKGEMAKKKSTSVMDRFLATNQTKAGLPSIGSGKAGSVGTSTQKKQGNPKPTAKKPSPPKSKEKRAMGEGEAPPLKRAKIDEVIRQKLVDSNGNVIPSNVSTIRDTKLAGRMIRVNILPHDYDKRIDLSNEEHKETLARLHYKLYCLEVAE